MGKVYPLRKKSEKINYMLYIKDNVVLSKISKDFDIDFTKYDYKSTNLKIDLSSNKPIIISFFDTDIGYKNNLLYWEKEEYMFKIKFDNEYADELLSHHAKLNIIK